MKKFLVLLVFILLAYSYAQAQKIREFKEKYPPDSTYISPLPFKFLINPSFYLKTNNLSLEALSGNGNKIVYKPNTPMKMAIVGAYKWLRLGFSFRIPSYLNDKGNTNSYGLYLNTQTHFLNWGLDFYWVRNQGYYLANPALNIPGWTDRQRYPFRSDLRTTNIGLFTHMVFSRKLSLKAVLQQSEKQLRSAGGMALQMGITYAGLQSDSGIIPFSQQAYYPEVNQLDKGRFYSFNIRPGYAYTYVYRNYYIATLAHVGIGFQLQAYQLKSNRKYGVQLAPSFKFQQVLGYNSDNAFVKLSFTYMSSSFHIKQVNIKNNFITISLGGGIRFL